MIHHRAGIRRTIGWMARSRAAHRFHTSHRGMQSNHCSVRLHHCLAIWYLTARSADTPATCGQGALPPGHTGASKPKECKSPSNSYDPPSHSYHSSKRVFILGPAHHVHLNRCDVSGCDHYATPLGELRIDKESKLLQGNSIRWCRS